MAILLRLIISFALAKYSLSVNNPPSTSDLYTYMKLASQVFNGEFSGEFYYQPFYYSTFVPFLMMIFGQSVTAVIIGQSIFGGLTVLLSGLIGKIVKNSSIGIISAILVTICNVLIFYTPYHKIATLQTFNVTLFTLLFILATKMTKPSRQILFYSLTGLVMGIACATRGNIYLLLFGMIPLMIWQSVNEKKKLLGVVKIASLFLFIFVAQLPYIIQNTKVTGKLSGASTASSMVLALGNTPEAPAGGRDYHAGNGPMEYPESYHIFMENEKERSVPKQIFDWFCDKPQEYIELSFRKVLLFWSYGEIPNNVSLYEGANYVKFLKYNFFGHSYMIIFLGIAGMFFLLKPTFKNRDFPILSLYTIVIFYQLSIAFFYNLGRFRAPILGVMAVFASLYLYECYVNRKNSERCKVLFLSMLLGVYFTFFAYKFYQESFESSIMKIVRPHGTIVKDGDTNIIFDYGPTTFGNWNAVMLNKGDRIVKYFDVEDADANIDGTLKFPMKNDDNQGIATLRINGQIHKLNLKNDETGLKYFEVPVRLNNKKIEIEVIDFATRTNTTLDFLIDQQRDYRRSFYNDENPAFEWIMRFYYE